MYRKKAAVEMVVDGILATGKLISGMIELATEVDQTIEKRKQTKELEKQTDILRTETELRKKQIQIEIEEEKKRAAIIREKMLAEMTPEEQSEFEISEILGKVAIRLEA
jgi:hypothetical protein